MKIIKRNGSEAAFDITKIIVAVSKANKEIDERQRLTNEQIRTIAANVEGALRRHGRGSVRGRNTGPRRKADHGARCVRCR